MGYTAADRLSSRFRVKDAPTVIARTVKRTAITFTELESRHAQPFETGERVKEDAFVIGIQLKDFPRYKFWEDGRATPVSDLKQGHISINDMKRDARAIMDQQFHAIYCHLPRAVFDEVIGMETAQRVETLRYEAGAGFDDGIASRLLMCVRPALQGDTPTSSLFLDHVGVALVSHLVERYGELLPLPIAKGGLAPWQERLVKEMISAHIKNPAGMAALARECGLSVRHFTRAFQASTGMTPHEWLQRCRVDRAKSLLATTDLSLLEVSEACGFADRSHLSRVFAHFAGTPPSSWRRRSLHQPGD